MTEDFIHLDGNNVDIASNYALLQIQTELQTANISCEEKGIPIPVALINHAADDVNEDYLQSCANCGAELIAMLNPLQRTAADDILMNVNEYDNNKARCFFIDGPGGTGKTFLYTALINALRGNKKRVLAVAWTGIAAILLPNGVTCHTAFRFPLDIREDSTCHMSKPEKKLLLNTDVIIWDEAPMAPRYALEIVDRVLRDITKKDNIPFGGKVLILGGDFRQVLPVIKGATRLQITRKCLKSSHLWPLFRHHQLTINMRADTNEIAFAQWLLQLGDNTLPLPDHRTSPNSIIIPSQCICLDVVVDIFEDDFDADNITIHNRVILSPFNEEVRLINERILEKLRGDLVIFNSIDTVGAVAGEDLCMLQQMYPVEFLNSVNLTGLPLHALHLKLGAVVMLIRNLSVSKGLCNGTRLIILDMKPTLLKVKIIAGTQSGSIHFIPRITLDTKDDVSVPFNLLRRQFPVKLAYCMTINKAQGQTFDRVGVYLQSPVFTHGQLYVACSRVHSFDSLRIQVLDSDQQGRHNDFVLTDNIVFNEVL